MPEQPVQAQQPTMKAGTAGVRAQIKAKRQPEVLNVAQLGLQFLERFKTQNVITILEFQKFIPLFNKARFAALSDAAKRDLYYDWTQKIDIQHAVYVIDPREIDEQKGVVWKGDNKKHKVIYSLPPKIRRLHQINRLGGNIAALAAEFLANAQSSSNPFDQRGAKYSGELGKVVKMANGDVMKKQDADFKKLHDRAMQQINPEQAVAPIRERDIAVPEQPQDNNNPKGLDAEWE